MLHALFGMLLYTGLSQVQAVTINFSGETSDATNPGFLTAIMELDVTALGANGGLTDLLTVTLTNLSDTTGEPESQNGGFTLSEAFFNFTGDSSLLSLDPASQGSATLFTSISADGFGTFDVKLDLVVPGNEGLLPNTSGAWTIDLGGTGFSDSDFNLLSDPSPGDNPQLAALFFSKGPCDSEETECVEDSAYTAPVVPVPAAVWLFGSGLLGLIGLARKKKS
jgi:hypothetical protein